MEKGLSARESEVQEGLIIDHVGRVIVPENTLLKAKLVLEAHEPPFCGHFGVKKITEIVCWFVAIFLLAETSYRCVATSLCWPVFTSASESPALPVMSLCSGPPITT